jgi:hypothetical protein
MPGYDNGGAASYEIITSALGLPTATHADSRMAGPATRVIGPESMFTEDQVDNILNTVRDNAAPTEGVA